MNFILFDDSLTRTQLLPLTFTRPIAQIRIGILTIAEKWEKYLGTNPSYLTEDYLQEKFPLTKTADNLFVRSNLLPNQDLADALQLLETGKALFSGEEWLGFRGQEIAFGEEQKVEFKGEISLVNHPWDIFEKNSEELKKDFALITKGRKSQPITDPYTRVYCPENIFLEEGAQTFACTLNATNGPIYIGKNAVVHENSAIQGPFALLDNAGVNMGAKIRGATTVGPWSHVGGEIKNSVIFGYSNKGHEGYLGDSVMGEWCNLGADTNTSNLKNTFTNVRVHSYVTKELENCGRMKVGLIMGDHSKAGINTMFNTGTVVGVCANIFVAGFPPKHIPSFSWGEKDVFQLEKAFEMAEQMMGFVGQSLNERDKDILKALFEKSQKPSKVY